MIGPNSDLAALKQLVLTEHANGDDPAVQGSVIAMDDRTPPPTTPVTTFLLPTDLPPGYYDLYLICEYGDGGSGDPRNIVRVGTQSRQPIRPAVHRGSPHEGSQPNAFTTALY